MDSKNLLLITPFFHPNIGGVETRLSDLLNIVSSFGHKIDVITYQPLTTPIKGKIHEKRKNISIWRIPWLCNDWFHRLLKLPVFEVLYILPGLFVASFFYMILYHKKVDVIHTPGLNAAIIGKFLSLVFRKRWVMSTHTIYELSPKSLFARIMRLLLSSADHIVTLSEPSRKELITIGLSPSRIFTELTWVDQDRFRVLDKVPCRKVLGISEKVFVVLFVGRLLKEKGIDVLIDIARRLPNVIVIIIGLGPMEPAVINAAKSLDNLSFHGRVFQESLPYYYNAADIFILPSLYREGLGRVVIESLSCGLPVLLSNIAAIGPLVEAATFQAPARSDDMVAIIHGLTMDRAGLELKRKNARKLAEDLFSSKNVIGLFRAYSWIS